MRKRYIMEKLLLPEKYSGWYEEGLFTKEYDVRWKVTWSFENFG